jgi:radical SAM protein with 4Fe4S-binding SPASM domain
LDKLIIAIDGGTKETYEKMKTGGDFDKLIENIKIMVEEKKKLKAIKPVLEMQIIISKVNEYEIYPFKKLAKRLGVDKYSIKTLCIPEYLFPQYRYDALKKDFLPESGPSRYLKGMINLPNACNLVNKANITVEGDLSVCCYEFNAEYNLGNVFKHSFKELWESKQYRKIRERMKARGLPICQTCPDSDIKYL